MQARLLAAPLLGVGWFVVEEDRDEDSEYGDSVSCIVERDANSSMVTTWTVASEGTHRSTVTVETTWDGASGVGGFFERTFAPKGLARIHDGVLANLEAAVEA